MTEAENNLVV